MKIRIQEIFEESRANGPGLRFVVFMQGCNFKCEGCINPQTHDPNGGFCLTVIDLVQRIKSIRDKLEGVTITGGEPFQQSNALYELTSNIKELGLSIIISTGYELDELEYEIQNLNQIINNCDVLICGRFHHDEYLGRGLLGSTNKRIILFTHKYQFKDIYNTPILEIQISNNEIKSSGTGLYDFFNWNQF